MKYSIFFLLILASSCRQSARDALQKGNKNEKYAHLLSKFKDISFDTLKVFSTDGDMEKNHYEFKGLQLDSSDAVLFPKRISEAYFSDPPGLFACYKFKIDSSRTALIARTPSEYYPSSIKLFIYTLNSDTLIEAVELAQNIGDAGAAMDTNSWLFKNSNKNITAFTWIRDSQDNSVENEKDTTTTTSDYFSMYNISTNRYDSLGKEVAKLPLHLSKLIITKASR